MIAARADFTEVTTVSSGVLALDARARADTTEYATKPFDIVELGTHRLQCCAQKRSFGLS